MICKYCGKPLSGGICMSCKKSVPLSYKSHELSDVLGLGAFSPSLTPPPSIDEKQLHAAYEDGFTSGKKQGYSIGWDAAQKDAFERNMRKQRLLVIIVASAMVLLATICSFTFNSIGFSRGYQQGKVDGKQEQKAEDDVAISEKLNSEYKKGKAAGYKLGYAEGILVTPSPTPSSTPSPTPAPIMVKKGDKNSPDVKQLQQRLIELGFLPQGQGEDDGDYGPKTEEAIKKFQKKNGITPVDGSTVRQDLWDLIMSEPAENPTSAPETSSPSTDVSDITQVLPEPKVNKKKITKINRYR